MMGYGLDWGFGGFWLGGLLVLAGVIFLAIWAGTALAGRNEHQTSSQQAPVPPAPPPPRSPASPLGPTPLDILRERFARGEISETEFEQTKRVLGY